MSQMILTIISQFSVLTFFVLVILNEIKYKMVMTALCPTLLTKVSIQSQINLIGNIY